MSLVSLGFWLRVVGPPADSSRPTGSGDLHANIVLIDMTEVELTRALIYSLRGFVVLCNIVPMSPVRTTSFYLIDIAGRCR